MRIQRNVIAIVGIATTCLLSVIPAHAERQGVLSTTVQYADLDLTTSSGVQQLYRRIDGAAERVCGTYDQRSLARRADWKRCYAEAVDSAVEKIGSPQLSQLHETKSPGRV